MCAECGKETTNPKFCSLSCSVKTQRRLEAVSKEKRFRVCPTCESSFEIVKGKYANKFCSRSCSAKHNNLARGSDRKCLKCRAMLGRTAKKYCGKQCQMSWQREEKIRLWLSGESVPSSEYDVPDFIRNFLIAEAGGKCSQCGWNEIHPKTNRCPLQIDHINGRAGDNRKENLRVLCPNCHSLTLTYGSLNRGNGRSYRYASKA